MTKQEFIQQYRVSKQAYDRRCGIMVAAFLGIAIVFAILVQRILMPLEQGGYFDRVAISINEYSLWGFFGCFALVLAFARLCVTQPYGVSCQRCGEKLVGTSARVALITGNCGYCGEKVLDADTCTDAFKSVQAYD